MNQTEIIAYGVVSPTVRMHGSGNKEVELIVASLTIIPNNPLAEFYSHLTILNFMPMKFRDARPKED